MTKVHTIIVATAIALLIAGQARATTESGQRYYLQTGSDLARVCANPVNPKAIDPAERERLLVCGSYIQGFLGHYGLVRSATTAASFCLPPNGVSGEQVRLLFLSLLDQKPQIRDLPASVDLATSLSWGYSCGHAASKTSRNDDNAAAQPSSH